MVKQHINKIDVDQFINITEAVQFFLDLLKANPNEKFQEVFDYIEHLKSNPS